MNRLSIAVLAVLGAISLAAESYACSMAGCSNEDETRSAFTIWVRHGGKPLAGVNFHIVSAGKEKFSAITDETGAVQVAGLTPGDYWINGDLLGTYVVSTCFHVNGKPSKKAKSKLPYTWGDEAPSTSKIAGELVDSQPGKGGTPIWNITHPRDVPIVGAGLKLQDPVTHATYIAYSDDRGRFSFEAVSDGTYILHIEGGVAGDRTYDVTDEVISLSSSASHSLLIFKRREPGGGSCGGTSLELQ